MKKFTCMVLSIFIFANMSISAFANNKTTDITTDELFLKYAQFLVKDEKTKKGLADASNAYYKVVNSYSDSDETYAAYMNGMGDGISITIKDLLGKIGIGETLYETCAREAATHYLQSMMKNENIVSDATSKISSAFKKIKTAYSVKSTVDKASIAQDLHKIAKENNISITPSDMDDLVDGLYGDKKISKYIKNADKAMDIWKVVVGVVELHALEKTTINMLMTELEKSGQNKSDLYLGLSLLKKNIEKDTAAYAIEKYCSEKALDFLVEKVDDFIFSFASGVTVAVVKVPTQFYANYIYKDAKGDKIAQAIMHTSFVSSIDICLSNYRIKFMKGNGTSSDIKTYKNLFNAYTSSYIATLEMCNNICKQKDKSTLGKECLNQIEKIKTTYTYDNHIKWSKELAKEYKSANVVTHKHDYTYGNGKCFCGAKKVVEVEKSSLNINLTSYPTSIKQGSSFGLRGTISSNYNVKKVKGYIKQGDTVYASSEDTPNKKKLDVKTAELNKSLNFGKLPVGNYSLYVEAVDASGQTVGITKNFSVYKEQKKDASKLSINLERYPVSISLGSSYSVRGSISSNYSIAKVKGYIYDASGSVVQSTTDTPNSKYMEIRPANLNQNLIFGKLPIGNYTMKVEAIDSSGQVVRVNKSFSVYEEQKKDASTLSINLERYPVSISLGSSSSVRGSISSNYSIANVKGYIYDASGSVVQSTTDTPNSKYMEIRPANLNQKLIFGKLSSGNYTMKVEAVDESGKVVTVTKNFTVKDGSSSSSNSSNGMISDGIYVIATKLDKNYALDIDGAGKSDGDNLQIWERNNTPAQSFKVTHLGDGYYRIVNTNSGKAIDAEWGGVEAGTNVWQYEINDTPAQIWKIESAGNGSYYIINKESGLYLDVENAYAASGTNVGLFYRNDAYDAQKWSFIK